MSEITKQYKIAVVGLGYVGLPLFCSLSHEFECWGYDTSDERVQQLNEGIDIRECEKRRNILYALQKSHITSDINDLKACNIYIMAGSINSFLRVVVSPLEPILRSGDPQ